MISTVSDDIASMRERLAGIESESSISRGLIDNDHTSIELIADRLSASATSEVATCAKLEELSHCIHCLKYEMKKLKVQFTIRSNRSDSVAERSIEIDDDVDVSGRDVHHELRCLKHEMKKLKLQSTHLKESQTSSLCEVRHELDSLKAQLSDSDQLTEQTRSAVNAVEISICRGDETGAQIMNSFTEIRRELESLTREMTQLNARVDVCSTSEVFSSCIAELRHDIESIRSIADSSVLRDSELQHSIGELESRVSRFGNETSKISTVSDDIASMRERLAGIESESSISRGLIDNDHASFELIADRLSETATSEVVTCAKLEEL
jgi:chromosome segregation ATPase